MRIFQRRFNPAVFAAALLVAMFVAPCALAVTFNVDSFLDQPDDLTIPGTCHTAAGKCTLRAAVMQANKTSGAGAIIMLPAGTYFLTIPAAGADDETNGDLNLTTPAGGPPGPVITITGVGAATTIIDGNQLDRVFYVHSGRTVSISGVTIQNGFVTSSGGGIANDGSLTVDNVRIYGNHAGVDGGGIYNSDSLTVTNSDISQMNIANSAGGGIFSRGFLHMVTSTLSQNHSAGDGGGLFADSSSTAILTNSTIDGNTASGFGAGLFVAGTTTVTNSTVKLNIADVSAGGIANFGDATVSKSTVSQNRAVFNGGGIYNTSNLIIIDSTIVLNNVDGNGGGIYNSFVSGIANVYNTSIVRNGADYDRNGGNGGGVFNNTNGATFNLRNSLVAENDVTNSPIYDECFGTLNSYGRNLFGADYECTVNTSNGVLATLNSFAFLGPLQNNGGPTLTVALLAGNNGIDLGLVCTDNNSNPILTDQRGQPRIVGASCDVGAYEYNPVAPPAQVSAKSRKAHGAGIFDLPL